MSQLIQISARHFCAGIVLDHGRVTSAAPILRYMIGWSKSRVTNYCMRKGWWIIEGVGVTVGEPSK